MTSAAASLTLVRNGGANADDIFSCDRVTWSSARARLELSSSAIGTYTNVGGQLVFSFTSGTTNAEVNEAMQSIAYSNSSTSPPASVQIDWTFDDGGDSVTTQGGAALQATGSTTVNIVDVPNPADIVVPIAQSVDEDTSLTFSVGGGNAITIDWRKHLRSKS